MKCSILKFYFLILLLTPILLSAEDKPKDPVKWTQYQGKKTWQEAKEHCQTMKMRLPTISELKLANDEGTSLGWRKNGSRYWAVNKNLASDNSTYKAISLMWAGREKKEEVHKGESQLGVFCANVTEESAELDVIREDLGTKKFIEVLEHLTWGDANKKCKSLKMRLPTIPELKEAYESGITKSWQNGINLYWSSTPYDAERYYLLNVKDGTTGYHIGRSRFSSSDGGVRCLR